MSISTVYFDCETTSLPDEQLELVKPVFKAPANYKDSEKIKANLAEQEQSWRERAALDATSARILCIGVVDADKFDLIRDPDSTESSMLGYFWTWIMEHLHSGNRVIGFNIFGFDIPLLIRRSWINGISVPSEIRHGRYWNDGILDVMDMWTCGNRDQRISLDLMSRALGIGKKSVSGADFGKLWLEDREKAMAYLKNDLQLTKACYDRLTA